MKVFITTREHDVASLFTSMGYTIEYEESNVTKCDLLCFTGGADVTPFIYGQRAISATHYSLPRDIREIGLWKEVHPRTPKVGICRGAQLGCVLSGGTLWQNVDNHTKGDHDISFCKDNKIYSVSSDHHQMCRVTPDFELLATANESSKYEDDFKVRYLEPENKHWQDVEAFYVAHTNFLGVQWHPEWMKVDPLFVSLVKHYCKGDN